MIDPSTQIFFLLHDFPVQSNTRCMSARLTPTNRKYAIFFSCKNVSAVYAIP